MTGEKTLRRFEDTASSVSVLTDEDLEERPGLATLDEALSQLPNVLATGTGNFAPQIRGSDTTGPANGVTAFIVGTRPRTTVQLDGRPLTYNEFVFGQTGLWDVARVEVLRGPQTTLQGRNSIAGAIIIDTKDPTFDFEGGARAIVGNYDTRQFSGMVSGPIVQDQLAFRVSADRRDHESYVDVVRQPIGVDDIEEEEATNARAKLLFLPLALPDFSAKLTFNHTDTRQPQVEFVNQPFDERRLTSDEPGQFPLFETQASSVILDLNYFLTPQTELRNDVTLGARYEREKRERAGSLGPFVIDLDETFDAFLPKLGIAYRPSDRFTYGATVQRGFNAGGAGIAFVPPFPSFTFDEEFVWNYEAFFRSRWLDNRLTVNGNVFYADFEDQQRSAFFAPNDPFASVIRNAESTQSYGAELTANWLARQDLEVFGALGLLETEIEECTDSTKDLSGNEFALAPEVTTSLGATYRHASGLSVGFDGQYAIGDPREFGVGVEVGF